MIYDYCIVGGGIVGLATALALQERRPDCQILLLEKERSAARHQTGHNSGVIHSGIYYAPGSLKAQLCKEGEAEVKSFCRAHGIPYETCGKLIVATNELELARLNELAVRAEQNGIEAEMLDAAETAHREPRVIARGALFVPSTGIVSYLRMAETMAVLIEQSGGEIQFEAPLTAVEEVGSAVTVRSGDRAWRCRQMIACAGLQADRIAQMSGLALDARIVPFRGEYFKLPSQKSDMVNHLIYPTPDPALPFLGIHLTRMIDGSITVGPNAILGMAREGYGKFSVSARDLYDIVTFPGTWRAIYQNRHSVFGELKSSLSRAAYVRECQKYCPELTVPDLMPIEAGIRAQLVNRDGSFANDFEFAQTDCTLHVLNAPSPAATSALPIGRIIAQKTLAEP